MVDVSTPQDSDDRIAEIAARIRKGVNIIDDLRRKHLAAKTALAEAKARAYLETEGTIPERNAQVVVATMAEAEAVDTAKAAYEYAVDFAASLRADLRAAQSIGASVRETYRVGGRGVGA